ncbi:MAG: hypothetical protein ACRYF4_09355 [Janthinobacterium lividum]
MLRIVAIAATTLLFSNAVTAQQGMLRYAGTVGQQHITLQLELAGDAVRGGQYRYDGQKSNIRFVDSRQFGTTVVLQDEDGNILHLHFEDAGGEKAASFQAAAMLEGTLDRGELDLPIKLKRTEPAAGKP